MSRHSDAIERIEDQGFVAELHYDTDPQSPKDWDNVGSLVTWSRRGFWDVDGRKEFGDPEDFRDMAEAEGWVYINVGKYEHSGVSFYEGTGSHAQDGGGWDSGQIGYLYATKESIKKCMGEGVTKEQVLEALRSELKTWDMYVQGQVYGYTITGPDGEPGDSCWGFYGMEYAMQEMKDALAATLAAERKAEEMVNRSFAL